MPEPTTPEQDFEAWLSPHLNYAGDRGADSIMANLPHRQLTPEQQEAIRDSAVAAAKAEAEAERHRSDIREAINLLGR